MKKLKILYLGMKYDYGDPNRGISFEENNFHASLKAFPNSEVTHFDFMELNRLFGKEEMNRRLLKVVKNGDYDVMFCVLFTDELDMDILKKISKTSTKTIAWGCDDHWRFDNYSKYWAPCFNFWVTTARSALKKFKQRGYKGVIKSQWACADSVYYPRQVSRDRGVVFIGQPHSNRPQIMSYIYNQGIPLEVYGFGWGPKSRIKFQQMLELFCRAKINLNIANSSQLDQQQIKGRVFEVTGCSGFLLTDMADDLDSYFEIGKEIVVYDSIDDLVEKAFYYLKEEKEREEIAKSGYERVKKEHTFSHRYKDIFKRIGFDY